MIVDRRAFLAGLGAMVGGVLIENALPVGRVYSFPSNLTVVKNLDALNFVKLLDRVPSVGSKFGYCKETLSLFNRAEFYSDRNAIPIKVAIRYGTNSELNDERMIIMANA